MTDEQPRRQFLAGIATAAGATVAGCSELDRPWNGDEASPSFTAGDAGTILANADPTPTVERPVPVRPERRALEDAIDRVDSLLESVPESLDSEDVPNGVVRESIADNRDEAVAVRGEVSGATGTEQYRALRRGRAAREAARNAATALIAIDPETDTESLVDDLSNEYDAVRSAVWNRRKSREYRGEDADDGRLRAALYHYRRESDFRRVRGALEHWSLRANRIVLDIAEAAGKLEFAAATADVWDHFDDRYEADVDEAVDLEADFADALERSIDRADEVDFPEQDDDDWYDAVGLAEFDEQPFRYIVWNAGRPVHDARERMKSASVDGELATGLTHALAFEQAFRAFEVFRDRIQDGSIAPPETVDEIRAERAAAVDAATAAREEVPVTEPSPGAYRLAETLQWLEWTDDVVRRAADNDPEVVVSLLREYGDYARIRAELKVLPDAVDAFRARLLAD